MSESLSSESLSLKAFRLWKMQQPWGGGGGRKEDGGAEIKGVRPEEGEKPVRRSVSSGTLTLGTFAAATFVIHGALLPPHRALGFEAQDQ